MDSPGKTKKKIWAFTVSSQLAGAEKIIEQIRTRVATRHADEFDFEIAVLFQSRRAICKLQNVVSWTKFIFSDADVIHTHLFWPALLVRIRKIFDTRSNWIHTPHYADYEGQSFGPIKKFLDQYFILPRVDELTFVSESAAGLYKEHPHAQVIPNSSEVQIKEDITKLVSVKAPVIGCIAMMRPEKGLFDLIQIFSIFNRKYPKSKLKIAGDGPLRSTVEKEAARLGVRSAIEFCGYVTNFDEFFKDIHIYVQPSCSESFGLAVLEALSYGKPAVAAAVGNLRVVLGNGRGELVVRDFRFHHKFVEALEKVVADYPRAAVRAIEAARYWQSELKPGVMEGKFVQIYRNLTRKGVCMLAPLVTHAKGGLQQQIYLQTRELQNLGYRIFILQNHDARLRPGPACDPEFQKRWSHVSFLMVRQPLVKFVGDSSIFLRMRGLIYILLGLPLLYRRRHDIQILHAHQLFSPTLLGVFAKRFLDVPLFVKVTASGKLGEVAQLKKLPFRKLRERAFQKIDKIFALTESMRTELLDMGIGSQKVMVLPNSVALPEMGKTPDLIAGPSGKPTSLIFAGRLSKEKSIQTLIQAAELLKKRGYWIEIDIVGSSYKDRDVTPELKTLMRTLHLENEVNFRGEVPNVDVYFNRNPLFILPSESEGMSNALLEALSFGLVCIVSDIPANTFLVQNLQNGILFKQGDAHDLANKIEDCIRDIKTGGLICNKISQNARQTIEQSYSTQVIGRRISQVYETQRRPSIDRPPDLLGGSL